MENSLKDIIRCPICDYDEVKANTTVGGFNPVIDCPRCGQFTVNEGLFHSEFFRQTDQKHLISGYLRETRETREAKRQPPVLTTDNIPFIIGQAPTSVLDKADKILVNLANMTEHPGKEIPIEERLDYPLGYCRNEQEFLYFRKYLEDAQLLEDCGSGIYKLTVKAWKHIEDIGRKSSSLNQVFIAMNFDKKFDTCYTSGIKEALKETGYKAYRIDHVEHVDRIDDKILSEIKRSKFIVAEFTGQKHGVYFEAGYAKGLGIPVIWTCREDDKNNLHFDTRQYNHIFWSKEDDLKEKLVNRIRVLIVENR